MFQFQLKKKLKKVMLHTCLILSVSLIGCEITPHSYATSQKTIQNQTDFVFSKEQHDPSEALIKLMNSAKTSLDIAIFSITKYDIVDAIVTAKKRGVKVRVITDKKESQNNYQNKELKYMKKFGIPILVNSHPGLMHLKVSIVDNKVVTTGSYDYSQAASTTNDEVLVILHDSDSAKKFTSKFDRMWFDKENFTKFN